MKPSSETQEVPLEDLPTGIVTPTPQTTPPPPLTTPSYTGAPPALTVANERRVRDIAGFELTRPLGEGGMGKVFLARQKSLDRFVALKVLTQKLTGNTEYVKRFELEAKAAAKLDHENIVRVIEQGEDNGIRFIAFEYVDGPSLEGLLKKRSRLPENESLLIIRQITDALRYAQSKNLVHRDVKPDNILLTKEGVPKLADLGLAKIEGENARLTQTGIVMGTPHYMAPEQALGEKDLDIRADLYALGLVFYRCLVGDLPWNQETALAILTRHINEDCPDPRLVVPEITEGAVTVLRGLTARDRNDRYLTPADALRDIDLLLSGGVPSGPSLDPTAATVLEPPRQSGFVVSGRKSSSGSVAIKGSSGRVGVANTLAASAAVGTPPTRAVMASEESKRNVVMLLGAVGFVVIGIAVGVLVSGRKPSAAPTPTPVVTTIATPRTTPVATPSGSASPKTTPVATPAPTTNLSGGPLLDPSLHGNFVEEIRRWSAHALLRPAEVRKAIQSERRDASAADAAALELADKVFAAVSQVPKTLATTVRETHAPLTHEAVEEALAPLVELADRPRASPASEAAHLEAKTWITGLRINAYASIFFASGAVEAKASLLATLSELPATAGAASAFPSDWGFVKTDLIPAVEAFDQGDYSGALVHGKEAREHFKGFAACLRQFDSLEALIAVAGAQGHAKREPHSLVESFDKVSDKPIGGGHLPATAPRVAETPTLGYTDFMTGRYQFWEVIENKSLRSNAWPVSLPKGQGGSWTFDDEKGIRPPPHASTAAFSSSCRVPVNVDAVWALRVRLNCSDESYSIVSITPPDFKVTDSVTRGEVAWAFFNERENHPLIYTDRDFENKLDPKFITSQTHNHGVHSEELFFERIKGTLSLKASENGQESSATIKNYVPDSHLNLEIYNRSIQKISVLVKK